MAANCTRRNALRTCLKLTAPGFTIALLSDFHYGAYVDLVLKSAVQACNRAQPDLVLLGGDFVTWHRDNVEHLKRDAYGCCQVLSGQGNSGHGWRHAAAVSARQPVLTTLIIQSLFSVDTLAVISD